MTLNGMVKNNRVKWRIWSIDEDDNRCEVLADSNGDEDLEEARVRLSGEYCGMIEVEDS